MDLERDVTADETLAVIFADALGDEERLIC